MGKRISNNFQQSSSSGDQEHRCKILYFPLDEPNYKASQPLVQSIITSTVTQPAA